VGSATDFAANVWVTKFVIFPTQLSSEDPQEKQSDTYLQKTTPRQPDSSRTILARQRSRCSSSNGHAHILERNVAPSGRRYQ